MNRNQRIVFALLVALLAFNVLPAGAEESQGVVNINTAGVEELSLLPRVGGVVAQRIVDFREQNGRFKALEDLMLVKGIGEKTFELIRPHVSLQGETTLTEKIQLPRKPSAE